MPLRRKTLFSNLNFIKLISTNIHVLVLGLFIAFFCTYFTASSFARFENFHTGRFDLGNMTQTVWNTSQGRIFQLTNPEGQETVSRLAFHADFILILFAPFYLIWDSPKVLLLTQATIVGLGAIFVYLIGVMVLENKNISLAFAFAYLLNPALSWSVLFDFHPVVLATTFLLGCIYFFVTKNYRWFLVFAVLAGITKEEVWFIIALFGAGIFFLHKKRVLGATVFLTSLFLFYILLWHAIPYAASSSGHFALSYFNNGGSSPSDLIKNTVSDPWKTYTKVTDEEHTGYLKALFFPLGYLPLVFPVWLVFPAADFVLNMLSDKEELHFIYYQYTATITPFLFASAIYAIYYAKRYLKSNITIIIYVVAFAIAGAYTYGPFIGSLDPSLDTVDSFTNPVPHSQELKAKLREIPVDKSLATTNNLGGFMSNREKIYTTWTEVRNADYIAFYLHKDEEDPDSVDLIRELRKETKFSLWYDKYGLTIFKKNDQ